MPAYPDSMRRNVRLCPSIMKTITATVIFAFSLGGVFCSAQRGGNDPSSWVKATAEDRALAARMDKARQAAEGTPGKESANFINTAAWEQYFYLLLKGERRGTAKDFSRARRRILEIAEIVEKGPLWPRPSAVRAPFADSPMKIDGKLDEPLWKQAAVFQGCHLLNQSAKLDGPKTVWRVTWDEKYLYFGFECQDKDLISPVMKRDDQIFLYDCVEMFILPEFQTGAYWEIVIGASSGIFDALHFKHWNQWGSTSHPEMNVEGLLVGVRVDGTLNKSDDTDGGYTVEVAVPFRALPEDSRAAPRAGQKLWFMLVRPDKNGGDFKVYSFQPLLSWGHNIWNHVPLELVK